MQINLNILTENNHSSLLSKNVPTADNALLQYMQKVTQGTKNADTEDKKQQKLQHIVNKLKHGKKLTAQEMEFLRMNYPDEYQHALRIQKMAEMLENQLKHAKSKQEADGYIAAAVSGIPDDDPDKECLVAAFNEISKEFQIFPVALFWCQLKKHLKKAQKTEDTPYPGQNFAHKPLLLPGKGQRQRKKKQDPCEKKDPQKQ